MVTAAPLMASAPHFDISLCTFSPLSIQVRVVYRESHRLAWLYSRFRSLFFPISVRIQSTESIYRKWSGTGTTRVLRPRSAEVSVFFYVFNKGIIFLPRRKMSLRCSISASFAASSRFHRMLRLLFVLYSPIPSSEDTNILLRPIPYVFANLR